MKNKIRTIYNIEVSKREIFYLSVWGLIIAIILGLNQYYSTLEQGIRDFIIIGSIIILGFGFYYVSFKKTPNPRNCEICGSESDIIDYNCNNTQCSNAVIKKNNALFITGAVLIILYLLFFSLLNHFGYNGTDTLSFELSDFADALMNNYNISNISLIEIIPLICLLIIINLSILSCVVERTLWYPLFTVTAVLIFSILTQNYDILLLLFSIAWFFGFIRTLKKIEEKKQQRQKLTKSKFIIRLSNFFASKAYRFIIIFLFFTTFFLNIGKALSKYSIIGTLISIVTILYFSVVFILQKGVIAFSYIYNSVFMEYWHFQGTEFADFASLIILILGAFAILNLFHLIFINVNYLTYFHLFEFRTYKDSEPYLKRIELFIREYLGDIFAKLPKWKKRNKTIEIGRNIENSFVISVISYAYSFSLNVILIFLLFILWFLTDLVVIQPLYLSAIILIIGLPTVWLFTHKFGQMNLKNVFKKKK